MNVFTWVVQIVLAALFAAAGVQKLTQPRAKLAKNMAWVEDYSDSTVKLIGGLELLAALGLVFPAWTGIAPVLTPLAASGLAVIMVLATQVHLRRREYDGLVINAVIFILAVIVAWSRFGPYSY
jgi:uncharacterized membrane protein YphA (DoxX/SURF4 family)